MKTSDTRPRPRGDQDKLKTWKIGLYAFLAMVTVTAAALGVAAATGATWGEAAGWVEASATTAALGAAVAAALLVWRTVQIELARERERLTSEQQAQAVLVAAWPTGEWVNDTVEVNVHPGTEKYDGIGQVVVAYRNASQVPIYDVTIEVEARMRSPHHNPPVSHADWAIQSGAVRFNLIRPLEDRVTYVRLDELLIYPDQNIRNAESNSFSATAAIYFTDAGNQRWKRSPQGLVKVSDLE